MVGGSTREGFQEREVRGWGGWEWGYVGDNRPLGGGGMGG